MLIDNEFDRELLSNVVPEALENPKPAPRYNLVVIGAGTAGLVAAAGAAGLGARVALIERSTMGGDCLNVGCVPSKSLLASAHAAAEIRRAHTLGVRVAGEVDVDFSSVMNRMRQIRAQISPNDSVARFKHELGVDVFHGQGRFTGPQTIEVDGVELKFKRAVIATGARPRVPQIPGLDSIPWLTNETVFDLERRPEHLLVLGGGPIGCEMAQAFRRLGSRVTLVEAEDQLLGREDADAARILGHQFQEDGLEVRLSTQLKAVEAGLEGQHRATVTSNAQSESLSFDHLLIAVGRVPNVEGIGLEEAGVEFDLQQGVHVSDTLQTTCSGIYAAGDVCMSLKFTHAADMAARAVVQNALFAIGPFGHKKLSSLTIPRCTYTDPEIAHVGLSEQEANAQGIKIDTFERKLDDLDRALVDGRNQGVVKIHVEAGRDKILGATLVAPHAGEMISEISVAMAAQMGLGRLSGVIHPYPTWADAIRQSGHAYMRSRLSPRVAAVIRRYLAFRR